MARRRDLTVMELAPTDDWEASERGATDVLGAVAPQRVSQDPLVQQAGPLRQALARYFRNRVPDPAEVDDLVQEVFTRIAARDSAEPVGHLSGFVFQIASNVLADRGRRRFARKADDHVAFDPDRHAEEDFDPHRILAGKEALRAATLALLDLPFRTREIFILHRLEGRKSREVAAQLGISVSAVEKHMVRAIQHLSSVRKRSV
ncbi:RNA polymerase sigma factor [Caulobacter endophyticus]|uniref:RNA polymerase sigma factor n=1 Tax=Caulobacter endophyticus TaxID=2172652 RepID=UPI00240EA8B5|nr:sigma-70 family RNA polymerase sigma factor [Caulobacter endophyticus]MDG2527902.1 sigma-70 family RNA polymerase sigma factor [Caulobacter endophyticus]